MADLTDILSQFANGDLARPNLFKVRIPYIGRDLEFKCKAAQLPIATVEKIPLGYQNKKINIAGDRTYEDWTISVYNDTNHETRDKFLAWQNVVQTMDSTIYGDYPSDYKKTATVIQLDRHGNEVKSYTLYGIFPTNVAAIELDWDNNNQVEIFQVTMPVDWWL